MIFRIVLCSLASALLLYATPGFAAAPVFTTTVQRQPFSQSIEALGTLKANEAVTLSSTVTDTIRAIHFDDGQRVEAGDILVEMTDREEHALLVEAQTEVSEAKRQYDRVVSLVNNKLATESLLDERKQAYEAAKARLNATRSRLEDRLIIAPFPGVLGMRQISVGTLVRPGDTITTLDDDARMKLDISLPALQLASVKLGDKIQAKTAELKSHSFEGTISSIDSRIDEATRAIWIRAILPNPDRMLKPGMLMTAQIQSRPQNRLLLPEESIVQEGYKKYVYRVEKRDGENIALKQEVTTGSRASGQVVVLEGLEAGMQVVTHGVMRLKNGAKVTIKDQAPIASRLKNDVVKNNAAKGE